MSRRIALALLAGAALWSAEPGPAPTPADLAARVAELQERVRALGGAPEQPPAAGAPLAAVLAHAEAVAIDLERRGRSDLADSLRLIAGRVKLLAARPPAPIPAEPPPPERHDERTALGALIELPPLSVRVAGAGTAWGSSFRYGYGLSLEGTTHGDTATWFDRGGAFALTRWHADQAQELTVIGIRPLVGVRFPFGRAELIVRPDLEIGYAYVRLGVGGPPISANTVAYAYGLRGELRWLLADGFDLVGQAGWRRLRLNADNVDGVGYHLQVQGVTGAIGLLRSW